MEDGKRFNDRTRVSLNEKNYSSKDRRTGKDGSDLYWVVNMILNRCLGNDVPVYKPFTM